MKILCTGDLHIGRRSSRIPTTEEHLAAGWTWENIVRHAVDQCIDVVLISGDLVDRSNRYFEAYGPLRRGVDQLSRHGIDVVAVAGNHDFDVLPRLVEEWKGYGFHLLGRGGTWETLTLKQNGEPALRVVGWSFPSEHWERNPLTDFTASESDLPTIGLLHADLDIKVSRYAPVTLAALQAAPVNLWLLGHIHLPRCHEPSGAGPCVLYPGTPHALDFGERGRHGIWILDTDATEPFTPRFVPFSPVRYDEVNVSLNDVEDPVDFGPCVTGAIRAHVREIADECGPVRELSCRLRFTGRTPLHSKVRALWEQMSSGLDVPVGDMRLSIDRIFCDTAPKVDLQSMSRAKDTAGAVARLLLELSDDREPSPATRSLIASTTDNLKQVHWHNAFMALSREASDREPDETDAREHLKREAAMLLDSLAAQMEIK